MKHKRACAYLQQTELNIRLIRIQNLNAMNTIIKSFAIMIAYRLNVKPQLYYRTVNDGKQNDDLDKFPSKNSDCDAKKRTQSQARVPAMKFSCN